MLDWLEARTGYRRFTHALLQEPVRGGARWSYVFGSALAILFLVQVATGLLLACYYSASSREAWGSVHFITHELRLGWFVRGLHHWAASAMIVLLVLHMGQVFLFGADRKPRELGWWTGVVLLFVVLAFSLTGYLLPWDQKGYWATRVSMSIAGTLPVLGERLRAALQGGNDFGTLTLTRFYTFHALLLPAALVAVLALHLVAFRRHGALPHWSRSDAELDTKTEPFWPRQIAYDTVLAALVLLVVGGLTLRYHGAPLEAPAEPAGGFPARPEWYFLWMFELLKFVPGAWEGVAVGVFVLAATAALLALPLVDRAVSSSPRRRWPLLAAGAAALLAMIGLTNASLSTDAKDARLLEEQREAVAAAQQSFALARLGIPPGGPEELYLNDPRERGKRLFASQCRSCHKLEGKGGDSAPDLTGYMTHAWVSGLITNAGSSTYYGGTVLAAGMPPAEATAEHIERLTHYVLSLGGHASCTADDASLFDEYGCQTCHARAGEDPRRGPSLEGFGSREWLRGVILTPGAARYFGANNRMPSFEGSLAESDIDDLLTYLLSADSNNENARLMP
jgi:quinol-cytochrome oxidoreductase complex cytochrome b subunit